MPPVIFLNVILPFLCLVLVSYVLTKETCEQGSENISKRYLLYDVNPGEGFNLRRDVYLRIANLIQRLNDIEPWTLVLPPWGNLYHWRSTGRGVFYPWKEFFDVKSLQKWIPAIELDDYIDSEGRHVDGAFVLQNFEDMWERGWVERYEISSKCTGKKHFRQSFDGKWRGNLWSEQLTFGNFSCLSFQGQASTIIPFFTKDIKNLKSIFLDHGEILLHDEFGGSKYWSARRSMKFADHLVKEADAFRSEFLDSDDEKDRTLRADDWRDFKPKHGTAFGGPYVATHMRRRDFVYVRKDEVPSIDSAAKQLRKLLNDKNLKKLFVASDAPRKEMENLQYQLEDFEVFTFDAPASPVTKYGDGGIAIIDQIICSHARYFIGTVESTFSFRIQEEREILGFFPETTFNRLCAENKACEQPSQWKIVYS